ncbi:flagellar filament capping protein FliD [Acetoanaerobium noterae]|uniref:flagellar filament capping protein FliD n=1 Tax=Acetoanaerobium noterae TaxID=745369 RepID=UPI003221634B
MVNPIRFGGMASGLDTESLVKQLVSAEKTRVDKFTQQKIWKQWQQTAYNETNKTMANFILDTRKNLGLTRTTSTGALVSGSINSVDWVKKASSSSTAFDVTASANAPSGVVNIKVNQLAKGANVSSQRDVDSSLTAESIVGAGNFVGGKATIKINNEDIVLESTDTISIIAQKIRVAAPELNASYDSGAKRFFMSTKNTGEEASISFDNDVAKSLMLGLNFVDETINDVANIPAADSTRTGQAALIEYNGGTPIKYQSNNISINGLNLTLKAETTTAEAVSLDTDVDGAYNKIKEFVDEYNKLLDGFNSKLTEKTYRDFQPLTDEQKEAMSETDIKLWEEKAKSGLLKNDETMTRMMQTIRQDIYQKVDGFGSIYELGITTGSWRDNGKLTIDETKLKDALRNDSEKVLNTLFKTSDTPEVTITSADKGQALIDKQALIAKRKSESGAFIRIFDGLTSGIKDIVDKSGPGSEASLLRSVKSNILIEYVTSGSRSLIDKDVSEIDKRISRETERLASLEERYWKQFTALEKAMSQMNSQSSWLSQQFGGGQQ